MSLVYLITGLPRLQRDAPPPLTRADLVARCRDQLDGADRDEFERLLQVESVEETVRLDLEARLLGLDADAAVASIVQDRRDGVGRDELPEWLLRPEPQHVLMRRHYFELTQQAQTTFLRGWAHFRVDLGEVVTAALCRNEGASRDAFLEQMQGSFDATASLIIGHWEDPTLGLGQRFVWLPAVLTALLDDDLVAMSRLFDGIAWDKIEELRPIETFCVETLMATYLQLRILERQAQWDVERGTAVLDRMLALSTGAAATGAPTSSATTSATTSATNSATNSAANSAVVNA